MTRDDMELVREYAATKSESAFAELVARHIRLVYSAALRQVRNQQLAEEVTQAVFLVLARKAASLNARTILGGWLHRTTGYVAANTLQAEFRRQRREREAYMDALTQAQTSDPVWQQVSPLLDEALMKLGGKDRDALVLRYFEDKSLSEVGAALGLQERAAQKRVTRALDKLRRFFTGRGITLTVTALAAAVSANSVHAAPAGLAGSISVTVAKGSAVAASTMTLVKGAMTVMKIAKLKAAALLGTAVIVVTGGTTLLVNQVVGQSVNTAGAGAVDDSAWSKLTVDALNALPPTFVLRPTHFPAQATTASSFQANGGGGGWATFNTTAGGGGGFGGTGPGPVGGAVAVPANRSGATASSGVTGGGGGIGVASAGTPGATMTMRAGGFGSTGGVVTSSGANVVISGNKMLGRAITFDRLMSMAYDVDPVLLVPATDEPKDRYDLLMTDPNASKATLQAEIRKQLGFAGHVEARAADLYLMTYKQNGAPGLLVAADNGRGSSANTSMQQGGSMVLAMKNASVSSIIQNLQHYLDKPVLDQTGLTGKYDVTLNVTVGAGETQKDVIIRAASDQLGLNLVPNSGQLGMIVVDEAK